MKRYIKIIAVGIFILCSGAALSQNIKILESRLTGAQLILRTETLKLDSLKNVLKNRIEKINSEKSKPDYNKEYVAGLMAGSISVSNDINAVQSRIDVIENETEKIKKDLSAAYETQIDSLRNIERTAKLSKTETNKIKSEIYSYIEKKILVAPKISLLSFRPEKIAKIDLDTISDPEQRKIYWEYLNNALEEINDRLNKVEESEKEIQSVVALQKKTSKFLEETEMETGPVQRITERTSTGNPGISVETDRGTYNASPAGGITSASQSAYLSQAQNYNLLLWQLKQSFDSDIKLKAGTVSAKLTFQQYLNLLKELKNRLSEYKLLLSHKIGNPG